MADFVSLLTGSDYSVDHFTIDMITASSDILDVSGDLSVVESQAKVSARELRMDITFVISSTNVKNINISVRNENMKQARGWVHLV